jgi:hypothetical protein
MNTWNRAPTWGIVSCFYNDRHSTGRPRAGSALTPGHGRPVYFEEPQGASGDRPASGSGSADVRTLRVDSAQWPAPHPLPDRRKRSPATRLAQRSPVPGRPCSSYARRGPPRAGRSGAAWPVGRTSIAPSLGRQARARFPCTDARPRLGGPRRSGVAPVWWTVFKSGERPRHVFSPRRQVNGS